MNIFDFCHRDMIDVDAEAAAWRAAAAALKLFPGLSEDERVAILTKHFAEGRRDLDNYERPIADEAYRKAVRSVLKEVNNS